QFVQSNVLIDVRTTVVNGPGLRRRVVQGSARNIGKDTARQAVLDVMEAPVQGRTSSGQPIAGTFETVASQFLGDLAPGRATVISLPLTRPDVLLRVYQIRLRTAP
ncbi:MAG: hypothetical protein HY303_22160, partial [Candidatus Wallbacteria bacterium]|nr:hypothetical protein [Candidatus Wallbacteria bacterium]